MKPASGCFLAPQQHNFKIFFNELFYLEIKHLISWEFQHGLVFQSPQNTFMTVALLDYSVLASYKMLLKPKVQRAHLGGKYGFTSPYLPQLWKLSVSKAFKVRIQNILRIHQLSLTSGSLAPAFLLHLPSSLMIARPTFFLCMLIGYILYALYLLEWLFVRVYRIIFKQNSFM